MAFCPARVSLLLSSGLALLVCPSRALKALVVSSKPVAEIRTSSSCSLPSNVHGAKVAKFM